MDNGHEGLAADGDLAFVTEHPAATQAQWQELVRGVLAKSGQPVSDADPPETQLATDTYDGLRIAPLYTASDQAPAGGLPGLAPFVRAGRPEGAVRNGWDIRARCELADPAAANQAILADLEHGVRSLWLVVGEGALPVADLPAALADVLLDLAPVTLQAGADFSAAAETLLGAIAERGIPAAEVVGNLGIDPIGQAARSGQEPELDAAAALVADYARRYPRLLGMVVDALPFHDAGGSDAQELGMSIAAGVDYLRALTSAGLDAGTAAGQLEFRYAITSDQFTGIAKLRAARRLWSRVTDVSGVPPMARGQRQHAVSSTAMMTRRDPWVNMLRTTIACFAAALGAADAVTVAPFDSAIGEPNPFARRIARNTQSILIEESHLARVIDPAGGSWYVEWLTDALARRAWQVFTEIERGGGITEELRSGALAARLAQTSARRARNIAHRTDPITGVSEFPNLTEKSIVRPPAATVVSGGLPRIRYAEPFEEMRDRSDTWLAEHGERPGVFLATLGELAAHTERAEFATNLLHSGGFRTATAGPTRTPEQVVAEFEASGLSLVCLCGKDSVYAEQAVSLVAELTAVGARRVLLAGPAVPAYLDAGVDEFLYPGCDALGVLRRTWSVVEERP